MDEATFQNLLGRLETNNYFTLEEFPSDKRSVVAAYLYGALYAGKVISLKYQGKRYSIIQTQGELVEKSQGRPVNFQNLSDMLRDGAKVRIIE